MGRTDGVAAARGVAGVGRQVGEGRGQKLVPECEGGNTRGDLTGGAPR